MDMLFKNRPKKKDVIGKLPDTMVVQQTKVHKGETLYVRLLAWGVGAKLIICVSEVAAHVVMRRVGNGTGWFLTSEFEMFYKADRHITLTELHVTTPKEVQFFGTGKMVLKAGLPRHLDPGETVTFHFNEDHQVINIGT